MLLMRSRTAAAASLVNDSCRFRLRTHAPHAPHAPSLLDIPAVRRSDRRARLAMSTLVKQRRFGVDEYHAMSVTGILGANERVELLEGVVGYGTMRVVRRGMLLTTAALADISLPVSQVLVE